jgi:hypothetical protein
MPSELFRLIPHAVFGHYVLRSETKHAIGLSIIPQDFQDNLQVIFSFFLKYFFFCSRGWTMNKLQHHSAMKWDTSQTRILLQIIHFYFRISVVLLLQRSALMYSSYFVNTSVSMEFHGPLCDWSCSYAAHKQNKRLPQCSHVFALKCTASSLRGYVCVCTGSLTVLLYFFPFAHLSVMSRDNVVGIATGYGLEDWGVGVRVPVGSRIFFSSCLPDGLWGPPSLLSNGYRELFLRV